MSRQFVATGLLVCLLSGPALYAQAGQAPENPAKSQTFLYEMALRSAIDVGGQRLAQQALVLLPELTLAAAEPAVVRGVKLPGYGFFFDVQAPSIQSTVMIWDMLRQRRSDAVQRVGDRATAAPPAGTPPSAPAFDADRAYTQLIKEALIDALLDSSGVLALSADERLTIVASGVDQPNSNRLYRAAEAKLMLTIKATDLADLRQGRITRDQAKERIVQERF